MQSYRHNIDLKLGNTLLPICAPRRFRVGDKIRYIYIADSYCQYVQLFDHLRYINDKCVQVAISNTLKLHSNTKGLYFNYSYWINNFEKKTIRVYICD